MSDCFIQQGSQLEVTSALQTLRRGSRYHFLINKDGLVRLAELIEQPDKSYGKGAKKQYRPPDEVVIHRLEAREFEWAIESKLIQTCELQKELPDRCKGLEGDTEQREEVRYKKKKQVHSKRVEKLLIHMQPLLANLDEVLLSDDPIAVVNERARMCKPEQNEKRFRAAFFNYIAWNRNRNVIAYQTQRIGRWKREDHPGAKPGVKATGLGAAFRGKSTDKELRADVRRAWDTWARPGMKFRRLYRLTCRHIWRTRIVKDSRGLKHQIRADGRPMLSFNAFYRCLHVLIPEDVLYGTLRGKHYVREELMPSLGRFSQAVANVGERTEADGYWIEERSVALEGKGHHPPIICVRIFCVASAMCLGIGFSWNGEKAAAYRMAQFCAAVPKQYFCSLFGMIIGPDEWPSVGVSDDMVLDRGVGSHPAAQAEDEDLRQVIDELTPTGAGQGKASIESTNPREIKVRDRPSFTESTIPVLHLIRREIHNTIAWNDAHSTEGRMTPRRIAEADRLTPLDLHNKLMAIGRTSCRPVPIAAAIRSFLTPVTLTIPERADGVYLMFQRYDSDELRASGALNRRVEGGEDIELKGYILDMSIRQVWVEVKGRLIEVSGCLHLREDEDQLDITYRELEELNEKLAQMRRDLQVHRDAVLRESDEAAANESGYADGEGRRRGGKPNTTNAAARDEYKEMAAYMTPRKRRA